MKFYYKKIYLIERVIRFCRGKISTIVYRFLFKNKNLIVGYGSRFYVSNIKIGNNVRIGNNVLFFTELSSGYLNIGNNVQIDDNTIIDCSGRVDIQQNVHISIGVTIYTHNHGYNPKNLPVGNNLTIKEGCWISEKVSILHNVHVIEKNILIGYAGLVVSSLNKSNMIYIGNPVVILKERFSNGSQI